MSDESTRDRAADAEWVLARGVVGWVSEAELASGRRLDEVVDALERRRDALEVELERALADGRAAGARSVEQAVAAIGAEAAAARTAVVRRAARAALVVAGELVGAAVSARPEIAAERVRSILNGSDGRSPERVQVAAELVPGVQGALGPDIAVVPCAGLEPADAVVEFADGKIAWRVAEVLSAWAPVVEEFVGGGDG